jgi:hypothetical protein
MRETNIKIAGWSSKKSWLKTEIGTKLKINKNLFDNWNSKDVEKMKTILRIKIILMTTYRS